LLALAIGYPQHSSIAQTLSKYHEIILIKHQFVNITLQNFLFDEKHVKNF
jgi:hypothetical protein